MLHWFFLLFCEKKLLKYNHNFFKNSAEKYTSIYLYIYQDGALLGTTCIRFVWDVLEVSFVYKVDKGILKPCPLSINAKWA